MFQLLYHISFLVYCDQQLEYGQNNDQIDKQFEKLSDEDIELTKSLGRIAAEPVYAQTFNPNSNVSSMDGYAINSRNIGKTFDLDLESEVTTWQH